MGAAQTPAEGTGRPRHARMPKNHLGIHCGGLKEHDENFCHCFRR